MKFQAYAAMEAGANLVPFEFEPGELGNTEVEIKVTNCGICHSDLSMLNNEWGMTTYPFVPGHEIVGIIDQVGDQVKSLTVGQTVGLGWHSGYCMSCPACLSGDHNLCSESQGTIVGRHGGFADRVRAQESSVIPIPKGMDLQSAGPLFCGGITVFNPLVQFEIKATARVGVIGIGGLGHLALQFCRAWGCHVTAFTSQESKAKEARQMGAHAVINSRDSEALSRAVGQFDLILSTVNVPLEWNTYISTLKAKGRLHFVGACLSPLDISVFALIGGQRSISGSPVGSPSTLASMLDFAHRHNIKPIIETYPMSQVNEALDHLESGKARYRIVLTR